MMVLLRFERVVVRTVFFGRGKRTKSIIEFCAGETEQILIVEFESLVGVVLDVEVMKSQRITTVVGVEDPWRRTNKTAANSSRQIETKAAESTTDETAAIGDESTTTKSVDKVAAEGTVDNRERTNDEWKHAEQECDTDAGDAVDEEGVNDRTADFKKSECEVVEHLITWTAGLVSR